MDQKQSNLRMSENVEDVKMFHRMFDLPAIGEIITRNQPFKFEIEMPNWPKVGAQYLYRCYEAGCRHKVKENSSIIGSAQTHI